MILVDPREGSAFSGKVEFLPLLAALGVQAELAVPQLDFGDFAWFGHGPDGAGTMPMCVERKALKDILGCIRDGRFSAHQLPGLASTYDVTWVVVEGAYRASDDGVLEEYAGSDSETGKAKWRTVKLGENARRGFMYAELDNWLDSIAVFGRGKILIAHTTSKAATAKFIAARYKHWTAKAWEDHKAVTSMQSFPDKHENMGMEFVKPSKLRRFGNIFDGVGWDKSRAVEMRFQSIKEAANAGVKEWTIKGVRGPGGYTGIGKTVAESVVKEIEGKS